MMSKKVYFSKQTCWALIPLKTSFNAYRYLRANESHAYTRLCVLTHDNESRDAPACFLAFLQIPSTLDEGEDEGLQGQNCIFIHQQRLRLDDVLSVDLMQICDNM